MKRIVSIVVMLSLCVVTLMGCGNSDLSGVWCRNGNSHSFIYIVGDGTAYYGAETDDKGEEVESLMYESNDVYKCEIDGDTIQLTNKVNEIHTYTIDDNTLIDEEGVTWEYIKERVAVEKDEKLY